VRVDPDVDIFRQRAVLRDLLALSAVAAAWTGEEPSAVATGLADALFGLLQLDFAFVRLCDPAGTGAVDVTRGAGWKQFPKWLERHLAASAEFPRKEIVADVGVGSEPCRAIAIPIGVNGGLVAVARARSDFPTDIDQLLLSHAVNQAAMAFESARLIQDRRQAEEKVREARNQLELKVAKRTAELRRSEAYLAELAKEQAALRRVATTVARESPAQEIFAKVAEEVGLLLAADSAAIQRFEPDGYGTVVGSWDELEEADRLGPGWKLEGNNVSALVYRTGRPARFDDYEKATGPAAASARKVGLRSAVGGPIFVNGRLWGEIEAATSRPDPMPEDAELRIAQFTELLATAISNIQARSDLAASRARIVATADEERRRVVRDLHDGVQQRLVHTIVTLKMARRSLEQNGQDAVTLVDEALEHAQTATDELRELAHGILPAVLTRGGLRAGVKALASRTSIPVEIDISVDRLPQAVEATAYFIAAEALTNVAKHSHANHATVKAHLEGHTLQLEVRDDGVGGARADGSGLVGLRDRLALLDRTLRVESPAGGGTLIAASIPAD
jgi:signal transduction histidine kinase